VNVTVNGESRVLDDGSTLADLLKSLIHNSEPTRLQLISYDVLCW
jgi:sulfur carrier protein ThiS